VRTKGHLTLYHWTVGTNVAGIRRDGLLQRGRPTHVRVESWPMLTASRQQATDQAVAYSQGQASAVITYSIPNGQVATYVILLKGYPADWPPWYALRNERGLAGFLITNVEVFEASSLACGPLTGAGCVPEDHGRQHLAPGHSLFNAATARLRRGAQARYRGWSGTRQAGTASGTGPTGGEPRCTGRSC
jgi:hypothetical protein